MRKGEFREILRRHLLQVPDSYDRNYRVSAVVVPIIWAEPLKLLLTRRSDTLASFRGQIAFPGGRPVKGESPLQTALREFEEEIGISSINIDVLGALKVEKTRLSDFLIYPIVAFINANLDYTINPDEVAELFTVNIRDIKNCERYHPLLGSIFQCGDHTIWGATYRIIKKLIRVLNEAKIPY